MQSIELTSKPLGIMQSYLLRIELQRFLEDLIVAFVFEIYLIKTNSFSFLCCIQSCPRK